MKLDDESLATNGGDPREPAVEKEKARMESRKTEFIDFMADKRSTMILDNSAGQLHPSSSAHEGCPVYSINLVIAKTESVPCTAITLLIQPISARSGIKGKFSAGVDGKIGKRVSVRSMLGWRAGS